MKIVKSWKKNLKRTGALALATLVMCGGASFARAEDNITLNQLGSDSTVEEKYNEETDNYETGNVKTVLGYQTQAAIGYAANISWGDMIFVYDNGNYNPDTGFIETTTNLVDLGVEANATYADQTKEIPVKDEFDVYYDSTNSKNYYLFKDGNYYSLDDDTLFEGSAGDLLRLDSPSTILLSKYSDTDENQYYESYSNQGTYFSADGHTPYNGENIDDLTLMTTAVNEKIPTFGHWYGFNGENNSVVIENLSTEDVYVSAAATKNENALVVGNAEFTLYAYDDHTNGDSTVNCWEGVDSTAEYKVNHNANDLEPTNYYVNDVEKTLSCKWYKHDGTNNFGRTFKASVFNAEDSSIHTDIKAFYLNISGTPGEGLKTEFNEEEQPNANGNILGTITLNFGPSAVYPTQFIPVLPQSNQVNQG